LSRSARARRVVALTTGHYALRIPAAAHAIRPSILDSGDAKVHVAAFQLLCHRLQIERPHFQAHARALFSSNPPGFGSQRVFDESEADSVRRAPRWPHRMRARLDRWPRSRPAPVLRVRESCPRRSACRARCATARSSTVDAGARARRSPQLHKCYATQSGARHALLRQ